MSTTDNVPEGMFERAMEVMKRGGNYEDFIQDEISKIVPPCPNCGAIRFSGEIYYTHDRRKGVFLCTSCYQFNIVTDSAGKELLVKALDLAGEAMIKAAKYKHAEK